MATLKVIIADEHADVRYALGVLLSLVRGLDVRVIGEAGDLDSLAVLLRAQAPDILLLDWGLSGAPVLADFRVTYPRMSIVVISVQDEAQAEALLAGADAFVCKGEPPEHLVSAMLAVQERLR